MPVGATPQRDSSHSELCQLCPVRLSRTKGKLHLYGNGHVCQRCYNELRKTVSDAVPSRRSRRPYDTLGPTQRRERRRLLRDVIHNAQEQVGCPIDALQPQSRTTPAELVHLPTSVREQIRTVPSLCIPSEQSMIRCKQQLADTHATATGTFVGGAYITDPIRFVSVVCAQPSFIAVGGSLSGIDSSVVLLRRRLNPSTRSSMPSSTSSTVIKRAT